MGGAVYIVNSWVSPVIAGGLLSTQHDDSVMSDLSAPSGVTPSDRSLVERMARGDESAAAVLFDRYAKTLYGVALQILGDTAEAEEVVLDAFMQVWRDALRYDPSRGSLVAWLIMIGRSRALDGVRARARRERAIERFGSGMPLAALGGTHDPSQATEDEERRRRVTAALSALPAEQREPIELAFFEGLSHSEIAARLQTPLGTVKTRVRSGMQKLRDSLRELLAEGAV